MFLHDHFAFTRPERRAIIVLLAVVLVLALIVTARKKDEESALQPHTAQMVPVPTSAPEPTTPFAFNPTTADSATLRAVGLSPFVSSNIVKYRRAGGHFRRPADLARIYGLDSSTFARIQPYIYIPKEESDASVHPTPKGKEMKKNKSPLLQEGEAILQEEQSKDVGEVPQPSPYKAYMENKLPSGTFLDLNKADSADFIRIPGIGPYYASRIVSLRRQLGGYVAIGQLRDIQGLPEIGDYVFVEEGTQQRINVNKATLRTLARHPYIGYYRAKAIMDIRHRSGRVINLRQLSFLDEFSDEDIQRLAPYLSFE